MRHGALRTSGNGKGAVVKGRGLFRGSTLALLASGGLYLGSTSRAAPGPRAGYFPNFTLRTHDGKSVRFYDDLIASKFCRDQLHLHWVRRYLSGDDRKP